MIVKCPHCGETNAYTDAKRGQSVHCRTCRQVFFVSYESVAAKNKESINETIEKEKGREQLKLVAFIAFFPALILTGLIVFPVALFLEHLELSGKLKLPNWLAKPAVLAIVASLFFIWKLSMGVIERKWFSSNYSKDEQKE